MHINHLAWRKFVNMYNFFIFCICDLILDNPVYIGLNSYSLSLYPSEILIMYLLLFKGCGFGLYIIIITILMPIDTHIFVWHLSFSEVYLWNLWGSGS